MEKYRDTDAELWSKQWYFFYCKTIKERSFVLGVLGMFYGHMQNDLDTDAEE